MIDYTVYLGPYIEVCAPVEWSPPDDEDFWEALCEGPVSEPLPGGFKLRRFYPNATHGRHFNPKEDEAVVELGDFMMELTALIRELRHPHINRLETELGEPNVRGRWGLILRIS